MINNFYMIKYCFAALLLTIQLHVSAQVADSAMREVKLQGAVNFRDIGGYATKDGKHVQWGRIYRSAALNHLTDADLDTLQKRAIAWIGDFRGPYEVKTAPDKIPAGATRVSLPAGSENIGDSTYMKTFVQQMNAGDSSLISFYSVTMPFKDRYKPLFDELLTLPKDSALLYHCTAGKDRTGIATALVLYTLGVDEQTIQADYLASNYYRAAENERSINGMVKMYGISETAARSMMGVKSEYLNATFAAIKQQYGSIDKFLQKELGLDKAKITKLRKLYLN